MSGLRLMAELGLDGSGFAAGFRKARGFAEGAGEGLKHLVIGAIGIGTVEEALRRTVETAKELVETSERLAVPVEQLQVLRRAALDSNVEFEKLAETIEKIDIARQRALIPGDEGKDARRAFSAVGVSTTQLRGQTGAELLLGPLRQAVLTRAPQELGIIFRELGVKSFGQLIPLLKTNFDELAEKLKNVGGIMDAQTAVELKYLATELNLASQVLITHFAPAIIKVVDMLLAFAGKLSAALSFWKVVHEKGGGLGIKAWLDAQVGRYMLQTHPNDMEPGLKAAHERAVKNFDGMMKDALQAFDQSTDNWDKRMEEFRKRMQEEADKLNHPIAPDLGGSVLPQKMSKATLEHPTNALLRIGNFLGSNQGIVTQINQKKVQLLQQIANNTKQKPAPRQNSFIGDAEPSFFPIA